MPHNHLASQNRNARIARDVQREMLRARDDDEDLTDTLERSLEAHDIHYCAPCWTWGIERRVYRRGAVCLSHYREHRTAKGRAA